MIVVRPLVSSVRVMNDGRVVIRAGGPQGPSSITTLDAKTIALRYSNTSGPSQVGTPSEDFEITDDGAFNLSPETIAQLSSGTVGGGTWA